MENNKIRTDKVRVMSGAKVLNWSRVQLDQGACPRCSVVVHGAPVSNDLLVMLGEETLFTGSIRKRSSLGRGRHEIEAHTDAHKVGEPLDAMSWYNAMLANVVQDIADAAGVVVNLASLPIVQLKRFSIGAHTKLRTTLDQVLRTLRVLMPNSGPMEWRWDTKNILQIGEVARMPKKTVNVSKHELEKEHVHGVTVLPTHAVAPHDTVVVKTDGGVSAYVVENACYVFNPSGRSELSIRGTRLNDAVNVDVHSVVNATQGEAAAGQSKGPVNASDADVDTVRLSEKSYTISKKHIDVDSAVSARKKSTRPGDKRTETLAIVIHYTATWNAPAINIRNAFDRGEREASAHYAVDGDANIIEIIPHDEVAWHCGSSTYTSLGVRLKGRYRSPNYTTVGIEMCQDSNGEIVDTTREATAWLVANLLKYYHLEKGFVEKLGSSTGSLSLDDLKNLTVLTTHWGVTGKLCP